MFDKYENELNLAVVFKLVRVLREQKGISRLTVSLPQTIDPFDAPIWLAETFPNWTIDGIEIVSPKAEGFEQ